ncbi:hypothetical protein SAMN05443507_10832 [Alicyclobacillus tolerans]|uniref:Uncharacterized protein n=1 Tax=Alicyclobacillus tolerans TaxID=90970 RepID=A0A1M6PH88_9BACL|nr:hypothetical protein SAMN05443507_10832 [Alicyclobacillus montanus]
MISEEALGLLNKKSCSNAMTEFMYKKIDPAKFAGSFLDITFLIYNKRKNNSLCRSCPSRKLKEMVHKLLLNEIEIVLSLPVH